MAVRAALSAGISESLVRAWSWEPVPERQTERDREAFIDAMFGDRADGVGGMFRSAWRDAPMRDSLPRAEAMVGASGGGVWVASALSVNDSLRAWWRVTRTAEMEIRMLLPRDERLLDARGDLVLLSSEDSLGRSVVSVARPQSADGR